MQKDQQTESFDICFIFKKNLYTGIIILDVIIYQVALKKSRLYQKMELCSRWLSGYPYLISNCEIPIDSLI